MVGHVSNAGTREAEAEGLLLRSIGYNSEFQDTYHGLQNENPTEKQTSKQNVGYHIQNE